MESRSEAVAPIPDDIMKAAREAYAAICGPEYVEDDIRVIASAITEERERAAIIGYVVCASSCHVTLSEHVRAAIRSGVIPSPSPCEVM